MDCRMRPETEAARRRGSSTRPAVRRALFLALCGLLAPTPSPCEERVLFGGLLDTEIWQTDDGSRLLSVNEGEAAAAARLRLWGAAEFLPGLQGFAMGDVEGGKATEEGETNTELEQAFLRYSFRAPLRLMIEAGQILTPIGNFPRRYLSNVNPLISAPDSYSLSYPLGLQVSGQAALLDYRVAFVDRPLVNEDYTPEPGRALRPMLSVGVTPWAGTRLAGYATQGPYLGPSSEPMITTGDDWKEFEQTVYGFDAQFSRGHFELNADFAHSSYDSPTGGSPLRGRVYFVEPKYTWSPRVFTALRFERNDYPFIMALAPGVWIARNADFYDLEIGGGYRFGPGTILKLAYRRDHWNVDPGRKSFFPDGYSVAVQLSYRFDVNSWFERPR